MTITFLDMSTRDYLMCNAMKNGKATSGTIMVIKLSATEQENF